MQNAANMMRDGVLATIEELRTYTKALGDYIFDHPELGNEEFEAHRMLCDLLEQEGFVVEREVSGLATAFRATYDIQGGGPKIGLLCEYDALAGLGHACGHHMQGPSIALAATALRRNLTVPATLVVLGTPAEETASGKLVMAREGVFDDLDVAFMMHGSDSTTVDSKSLALNLINFNFHGKESHAAIAPHKGVSALDAVLQFFNGMEYLREHVAPGVKFHGIITDGGKAANIVPGFAQTQWYIRAETRPELDAALDRVYQVARGAASMVGATVDIETVKAYDNKFNVPRLNSLLLEHAEALGLPDITEPRKVTGSTDFSSVTYRVPGACIRVKYVDRGCSSHSQPWLDQGKTEVAESVMIQAAQVIAFTVIDLLTRPEVFDEIRAEFHAAKSAAEAAV